MAFAFLSTVSQLFSSSFLIFPPAVKKNNISTIQTTTTTAKDTH